MKNTPEYAPKSSENGPSSLVVLGHIPSEEMTLLFTWIFKKAPPTQKLYKRVVGEFFSQFPGLSLKKIELGHLLVFFKDREALKSSSQNVYRATLSSLFSFLVKAGYLERNLVLSIDRLKVPDSFHSKVLTFDQVQAMVRREPGLRNQIIIMLLYYSGLRVSELVSLKVGDFQLRESGEIQLTVVGKGSKTRSVLVPLSIWEDLKRLLHEEGRELEPQTFLFQSFKFKNERLDPAQVYRIIEAAGTRANIPGKVSPHWMRHTSATHALENGAPVHVVQRTLGHESLSTTGKYLDSRPKESSSNYLKVLG